MNPNLTSIVHKGAINLNTSNRMCDTYNTLLNWHNNVVCACNNYVFANRRSYACKTEGFAMHSSLHGFALKAKTTEETWYKSDDADDLANEYYADIIRDM